MAETLHEPIAVTYATASQLTGLSVRQLKRAAAEGRLPVSREGRAVRILVEDLRAFLAAGRQTRNSATKGGTAEA
jgi:excisionase family DNA binding protein